jgi:type II secretory pathway component GspD/PulD (secretin)
VVKAQSYDIVIIGGLMAQSVGLYDSGPNSSHSFLDALLSIFSSKKKVRKRSELIILLRPIIIENEDSVLDTELKEDVYEKYYDK